MTDGGSNTDVWTVSTKPDLGMTDIYLSKERLGHILLGHRDLGSVIQTVVRETVENPTNVNLSKSGKNRMLFVSSNIQTGGGRAMGVVVERENSRGKVITATQMNMPKRDIVWESSGSAYSNYDKEADIFYISKGGAQESYVEDPEQENGIWFRRSTATDSPIGVTIFMFSEKWGNGKLNELAKLIADFLFLLPEDIMTRVNSILNFSRG